MNIRTLDSTDYIGKDLGNVTIIREIGRGAMGVVFLGYQKSLKRQVAVKVLPKKMNSESSASGLFRDEAETVAVLSHPNIVPIFEMDEDEDCYFQTMQLIEGDNLRTIIRARLNHPLPSKRVLPLTESLPIIDSVLDALAYAHEEGVVHQDVKPSNVIIDRKHNRPYLMDFGIARVFIADYRSEGKVVGSPLYMSPEQACGFDTDARSDIYATGIIVFEIVAGNLPLAQESADKIVACKQTDPSRLFAMTPRQAAPGIPRELEQVILKAIAPDARDRYQDCQSFRRDLAPFGH